MKLRFEYKEIGSIGNYYGGINVCVVNGKYYWCIGNYTTNFSSFTEDDWTEIDKSHYDYLVSYEENRKK